MCPFASQQRAHYFDPVLVGVQDEREEIQLSFRQALLKRHTGPSKRAQAAWMSGILIAMWPNPRGSELPEGYYISGFFSLPWLWGSSRRGDGIVVRCAQSAARRSGVGDKGGAVGGIPACCLPAEIEA
jgi:hypothetical protein